MTIKSVLVQPTKKVLLWGYFSNVILLVAGVGLLPIILTQFDSNKLALYFILQSILSIVSLFDLGYGPQLSKQVTYILSGAQTIEKKGMSQLIDVDNINYQLFYEVIGTTKCFYKYASLLSTFICTVLGYFYIENAASIDITSFDNFWLLWMVFGFGIYIQIKFSYITPILNGAGLIIECRKIIVLSKTVYICISLLFIALGQNIISLFIANFFATVSLIIYGKLILKKNGYIEEEYPFSKVVFWRIIRNANKIGLYYLSSIFMTRGMMLIAGRYLNSNEVSSYGLLVQLLSVINNFAGLFNTLFQTKISKLRTLSNEDLAARTLSLGLLSYWTLASLGVLSLVFLFPYIIVFIQSNISLPSTEFILLFSLYSIVDMNTQIFVSFITTKNKYPFVTPYLISAAISVIFTLIAFEYFTLGLTELILVPFIVQCLYNYWKWPKYVCTELDLSFTRLLGFGVKK